MTPWIPFFSLLTIAAALWLVMRLTRIHRLVGPPTGRYPASRWTQEMAIGTKPAPPIASDIVQAHLHIRGVGYTWRGDVHMWCVFYTPVVTDVIPQDDGYLVFVTREATLSGWLNACDALQFHHLRRDADGCIMSPQNIDPATGQIRLI